MREFSSRWRSGPIGSSERSGYTCPLTVHMDDLLQITNGSWKRVAIGLPSELEDFGILGQDLLTVEMKTFRDERGELGFFVDTGGTFTDCLGRGSKKARTSQGTLKGKFVH